MNVRVEVDMFPAVLRPSEVSHPDVVPGVRQDEGEAAVVRGDPAVGGAHHPVHQKYRFALAWDTMKLQTIAIFCYNIMTLNLQTFNILKLHRIVSWYESWKIWLCMKHFECNTLS